MSDQEFKRRYQLISGVLMVTWVASVWLRLFWLSGIAAICIGVSLIYFHKRVAQMLSEIRAKQQTVGKVKWYPRFNRILLLVMGIFATFFGILMLISPQPI